MTYQEQLQKQQEEYEKKLNNLFSLQPVPAKDTISLSSLSKQKQKYLKNISLQSYLQSKKLRKVFSPFSDTDKDTFVNIFDCYPFDPNRHGIGDWLRGIGRRIGIIKPKPKPTPKTPYEKSKLAKDIGYKPPSSPLHKTLKEAEKKTISRGGGGRAVSPPSPKVDISQPPAGYSKGAWENIKKLLGEEAARRIKLGKAHGVKFEYDEKGRIKKIIRPTATGTKTSYVVYDKAGGREVSKEEYKKITAKPAPQDKKKDKLRLGAAVVSAYTEPTSKELKESKRLKELYGEKWYSKGLSEVKKAILELSSALPRVDLTTKYGLKKPPAQIPIVSKVRKETLQFRTPTIEEYEAMGFLEHAAEEKIAKAQIKEQVKLDVEAKRLQEKINAGKKGYEEAVKELEKKRTEAEKRLKKQQEKVMKETEKKIRRRELGAKFLSSALTSAGYALVGTLAPPVGYGLMGLGGAQVAIQHKEIAGYAKKYPYSFGAEVGGMLVGGFVGGMAGAKIRGKFIEAPKIKAAINNAKVKLDYKQLTTNKQIKQLLISPEGKRYLQQLADRGFIIRRVTARLTGKSKYLPNVRSEFIEILTRDGKIVDRISLGKFIAKSKTKTYSRDIIADATGKLDESTGTYFTRVFVSKAGKNFKPIEYYEFLEQTKATGLLKKGKYKAIKGELYTELLKKIQKPTFEDITKIYRVGKVSDKQISEMLKGLKGKPYATGKFVYVGKELLKRGKLLYRKDIATKWQELIGGKYVAEYGYGRGVLQRIIGKVKKVKKVKKIPVEEGLEGVSISKPPKLKFKGGEKLVYVRRFPYQTPSSIYQALTYEQTYVAIPRLTEPYIPTLALQSFLIGGLSLRTKQEQFQINLQKLSQPMIIIPKTKKEMKLTEFTGQIQPQKLLTKQYLKQINQLKEAFSIDYVPTALITPTIPAPKIPPFIYPFETEKLKREKKKRKKAKLKPQPRAYQASVGAVLLGYEVSPEQLKKLKKQIYTGLELRPVIRKEAAKLRKQQFNLLESAIGTAKKGSPRKAVKQLRKQYEENLKKMLSYAHWDKKRSKARRKVKRKQLNLLSVFSLSTIPIKIYNPYRQGESRKSMLRRLQKILV